MVRITENANLEKMLLFRWNQKPRKYPLPDKYGICVFHVDGTVTTSPPLPPPGSGIRPGYKLEKSSKKVVHLFEHTRLLSTEAIKDLALTLVLATRLFEPETVYPLGKEISDYLLKNFHFTAEWVIGPAKPNTIIFINVNRNKLIECAALEELDYFNNLPNFGELPDRSDLSDDDQVKDWKEEDFTPEELEFNPEFSYTRDHWLVLDSISRTMGIRERYPLKRIALDEPPGLFVVEPVRH